MKKNLSDYFKRTNDIAAFSSLNRILRSVKILDRKNPDNLSLAQIIYPCMQATDIFLLKADICQHGKDQRKVNMLAIEYAKTKNIRQPIVLSHHMIMSLKGKGMMKKYDPDGAIFIEDTTNDIFNKINEAICPDEPDDNPLFEYLKYIILKKFPEVTLCGKRYQNSEQIRDNFSEILTNKSQFKKDVASYIDIIIQAIRNHFKKPELLNLANKISLYRASM